MARKPEPWEAAERAEQWLGRSRSRSPLRFAEQLLRPQQARAESLAGLEVELAQERGKLAELEREFRARAARVAALQEAIEAYGVLRTRQEPSPSLEAPHRASAIGLPRTANAPGRNYWLCRCEGFAVKAGRRRIGIVTALRFRSRADRPDALEVRRLLFRQELVPIEEVEAILEREKTVLVRAAPRSRLDT